MANVLRCESNVANSKPQIWFSRWVVATWIVCCGTISFVFGCGVRILSSTGYKSALSVQPGRLQNMHQVPLEELKVLHLTDTSTNYTSLSQSWSVFDASDDASDRDDDDESAAGIGNQLLIDMKNIKSNFLNSEKRLKKGMIALLTEIDFKPMSYHCHSLSHTGFSCHGHFRDALMNLYTFPFDGVISLDLFIRDENDLISFLEKVKGGFAIPEEKDQQSDEDYPPPQMIWTHKLRNFRLEFAAEDGHEGGKSAVEGELTQDILSQPGFEMKKQRE